MFGRLMDEYVIMIRPLKKLRYFLTNFCGFLRYGKQKIELYLILFFFVFVFVFFGEVMVMQLLFTCKCLLSFAGNASLIFLLN